MTTEKRLDTVEVDLEAVKQMLASAARYSESANQKLDRLSDRVDSLTTAQANTLARIDDLTAAQANTLARIDDLTAAQARTQTQLDRLGSRIDQLAESQAQTQVQLNQLVESQAQAFVRLDRIDRALDTLASNQVAEREARLALREDLEILYQAVQLSEGSTDRAISQLTERVDQLTERVNQLTQGLTTSVQDLVGMIGQLANDAAQDRAETRRIWEYLLYQSGNGSSG